MRHEFSNKTKLNAYERAAGCCEGCGTSLHNRRVEYHHENPAWFDGAATLENCRVLCIPCHRTVTKTNKLDIAKSKRIIRKAKGIRKASRWPYGKASPFKKKLTGEVVRR